MLVKNMLALLVCALSVTLGDAASIEFEIFYVKKDIEYDDSVNKIRKECDTGSVMQALMSSRYNNEGCIKYSTHMFFDSMGLFIEGLSPDDVDKALKSRRNDTEGWANRPLSPCDMEALMSSRNNEGWSKYSTNDLVAAKKSYHTGKLCIPVSINSVNLELDSEPMPEWEIYMYKDPREGNIQYYYYVQLNGRHNVNGAKYTMFFRVPCGPNAERTTRQITNAYEQRLRARRSPRISGRKCAARQRSPKSAPAPATGARQRSPMSAPAPATGARQRSPMSAPAPATGPRQRYMYPKSVPAPAKQQNKTSGVAGVRRKEARISL